MTYLKARAPLPPAPISKAQRVGAAIGPTFLGRVNLQTASKTPHRGRTRGRREGSITKSKAKERTMVPNHRASIAAPRQTHVPTRHVPQSGCTRRRTCRDYECRLLRM